MTEGSFLPEEIVAYYDEGREADRLFQGIGPLELARTQELIQRYLNKAPAVILDASGGSGIRSAWLALAGYEVHLINAMPRHVEQARRLLMTVVRWTEREPVAIGLSAHIMAIGCKE